jgi:pSer/pThr/pTyr-binding forkhead associated (FHA) protein
MLLKYKKADGTEVKYRLKSVRHSLPITLGRDKEANIPLDDPQASRIHTAIRYWDGIFVVRDMDSSNGTLLNGEKIDVAKLNPGDIIKIGNTEIEAVGEAKSSEVTTLIRPHE